MGLRVKNTVLWQTFNHLIVCSRCGDDPAGRQIAVRTGSPPLLLGLSSGDPSILRAQKVPLVTTSAIPVAALGTGKFGLFSILSFIMGRVHNDVFPTLSNSWLAFGQIVTIDNTAWMSNLSGLTYPCGFCLGHGQKTHTVVCSGLVASFHDLDKQLFVWLFRTPVFGR